MRGGEMADDVLVIGGGPAGLATAACLGRKGIPARVIEQGPAVGHSWARYYDRLRLHTGKALSNLPFQPMPRAYPRYVPRARVVEYLHDYAKQQDIAVSTGEHVLSVSRDETGWRVETSVQVRYAPAVVVATGFFDNPHRPAFPGQETFGGQVLHSAAYRNPASVTGQRVLVVGLGNSGAEIAVELADAGRDVSLSVRSGVSVVPRDLFGVLPIQYAAYLMRRMPPRVARPVVTAITRQGKRRVAAADLPWADYLAIDRIPVIGLHVLKRIRAGRIAVRAPIDRFSTDSVHFTDGSSAPFDAVVFATGFLPALAFLQPLADDPATLIPAQGVACAAWPGLYFVGYHRTTAGVLYLIGRVEAPQAAAQVAAQLGKAA
jgi:cation diffusion facilitator CzcD-associated flavoprotein CzcO